jgi:hypothetical protein
MSLSDRVSEGLAELEPLDARDRAVADLAVTYALAIDCDEDGKALADLGPKLLAALQQLGMTPSARKAAVKGAPEGEKRSPLDELRARRAARQT